MSQMRKVLYGGGQYGKLESHLRSCSKDLSFLIRPNLTLSDLQQVWCHTAFEKNRSSQVILQCETSCKL